MEEFWAREKRYCLYPTFFQEPCWLNERMPIEQPQRKICPNYHPPLGTGIFPVVACRLCKWQRYKIYQKP